MTIVNTFRDNLKNIQEKIPNVKEIKNLLKSGINFYSSKISWLTQ